MATFSERLKELRTKYNLSQAELGKRLRISKGAINNYEHATREPNFEILESIADFFNVDIDYLLGKKNKTTQITLDNPTYVIGENGEREVKYNNQNPNRSFLLEEMGVKIKKTNYIMSKDDVKTELSDNEYDFLINSLGFYRKK